MKILIASLMLFSVSAFAHETESCWGGPYWTLMDKSQRICNWQEQVFEKENGVTCRLKYHNSPNVCYSNCVDPSGKLAAKLRVDMTSNCDFGTVKFQRTKATWYR